MHQGGIPRDATALSSQSRGMESSRVFIRSARACLPFDCPEFQNSTGQPARAIFQAARPGIFENIKLSGRGDMEIDRPPERSHKGRSPRDPCTILPRLQLQVQHVKSMLFVHPRPGEKTSQSADQESIANRLRPLGSQPDHARGRAVRIKGACRLSTHQASRTDVYHGKHELRSRWRVRGMWIPCLLYTSPSPRD